MDDFNTITTSDIAFNDPSKFPSIDYDISLVIPKGVMFNKAQEKIKSLGIKELNNIGIIDVYDLPEETSVTVRFTFSAFERTLTMDEVQKNIETITNALKDFDIKARF